MRLVRSKSPFTSEKAPAIRSAAGLRQTAAPAPGIREGFWYILFILLITTIAYLPVFGAGFVNWDDPDYVREAFFRHALSDWRTLLGTSVQGNYHPLTTLSLLLNYRISGMEPWSYHLLNLLLHLINCVLSFRLAFVLSRGSRVVAFVTALLFGIHPMHVESVAWVSERKDVLYGLFFLAGLIAYTGYVDSGKRKPYYLALLFLVLSVLSKPAAVIFPVVLFSVDLLRSRSLNGRLLAEKLPFCVICLSMGIITYFQQKHAGAIRVVEIYTWGERLLIACYGVMMYTVKLLAPVRLVSYYPFPPTNLSLPLSYQLAPLFVASLAACCWYSWKKTRVVTFGILFFISNLLLVLQLLPVGSAVIADRYTYLPYFGLFFMAGWGVHQLAGRRMGRAVYWTAPLALVLAGLTYRQAAVWRSPASLWDHAIAAHPSWKAYAIRADLYQKDHQLTQALACYSQAIRMNRGDFGSYYKRGVVFADLGKGDAASRDFRIVLSLAPDHVGACSRLGALFGQRRQFDSSFYYLDRAIRLNPHDTAAYRYRAALWAETGHYEAAIKDLQQILKVHPGDGAAIRSLKYWYPLTGRYPAAGSGNDTDISNRR